MATLFLTVRMWRMDEGIGASRECSRVHTGDERATDPHTTTCVAWKCMETGPKGTHCVIHSDDTGKGEITRGENRSVSATKHPCETEIDKPLALNQTHLATGSVGSQLPHTMASITVMFPGHLPKQLSAPISPLLSFQLLLTNPISFMQPDALGISLCSTRRGGPCFV